MHITEAAKKLNTTPRTIRLYEDKGLISLKKDKDNGYRYFSDNDLMRLSTILALREIGIAVADIQKLLADSKMEMNDLLNVQRAALYEQWLEMKDMISTIDDMLNHTKKKELDTVKIYELAQHLKNLKIIRKNWKDKWNFDSQAEDYDTNLKMHGYRFNVHQNYETALDEVVERIHLKEGDTCLDIGIGTGNLGSKFLKQGIHVIGVDQSEKMLEVCKEKHPQIEVRNGHFLALPLLDNFVDGIVSSYALHHLQDEEKMLALEEMNRVIKPGGEICIADLMFIDDGHRKSVMESFQQAGNTEAIEAIKDEFYADRSELITWFSGNDYEVESIQINPILSVIYAKQVKG
ncbi:methyltransferase domain-containing protein [Virgibacillus oceani]